MARLVCTETLEGARREVDDLAESGGTHARIERAGCGVAVLSGVAGLVLLALGRYEAMLAAGVVTLVAYVVGSSADPALAEDPRVAFTRALLAGLAPHAQPGARLRLELDLRPADAAAPVSRELAGGGLADARYVQRWLTLELPLEGGRHLALTAEARVAQREDGIWVVHAEGEDRFALRVRAGDETLVEVAEAAPLPTDPSRAAALVERLA